ncbi:MAG: hypothetical protein JW732_03990 [Dehalococcoidia bacterium]|nr:hypothetical protein [Dehalococcoidia bacterium]
MSLLSMNELRILMEKPEGLCISIFMPTHRAGEQTRQDPIRLKNLIREAQNRLTGAGLTSKEMKGLLKPVEELLRDEFFWQHQNDGLAIFSSAGLFRCYRLPLSFDELVVVTHRFHIKPLLPLLTSDGRFYILALSQNKVRLVDGTRYTASEVALEDVPESLADTLRYDSERNIQLHTAEPVGKGGQPAIFHGHGDGIDDAKENILKYFRQIDAGLSKMLHGEHIPLILAGVDYLLPIYAKANTYPCLLGDGFAGNPEELSTEELCKRAWAIAEPYFTKERMEASARYEQLLGTQQASDDLMKVVPASYQGRIETLFVAVGVQYWGTFDIEKGRITLHQQEVQPGDEDLLDFAAIHTLLNGGVVFAVAPEQMPGKANVAAVFRY